jgi:hypothetical protein
MELEHFGFRISDFGFQNPEYELRLALHALAYWILASDAWILKLASAKYKLTGLVEFASA